MGNETKTKTKTKADWPSTNDFIRYWQKSPSLEAVATWLGITIPSASTKASRLRRLGYDLKRFQRGTRRKGE